MSAAPTVAAKPFEAIPTVPIPADIERELPRWIAAMATEHGPIFRGVWPGGASPVYLVGPAANRFVLHTGRAHFSHDLGWTPIIGEILGKGVLNTDGAEHDRDRKMMNPAFTIAYMDRYLPIMTRIIAARTRDWAARGAVDLFAETRRITFDVAAETLVGLRPGAEADRLRTLFMTLIYPDLAPGAGEQGWYALVGGALRELRALLTALIAERRRTPSDDVLGMLVRARDEEGRALGDEQLLGHVNILLVAGHETSTTLSAWLLYLLATHPDYLARVRAEVAGAIGADGPITLDALKGMRVLGNALTEAGRLHPPVGNGPRGVVREFVFGGYRVPAGARVRYSIAGGHWLPAIFPRPERFDPDRFAPPREEDKRTPYALVPFGGGPRICIGVNFAQIEIKALAAHVLRAYDLEPVAGREPEQIYAPANGAPFAGVPVRVRERAVLARP